MVFTNLGLCAVQVDGVPYRVSWHEDKLLDVDSFAMHMFGQGVRRLR